MRILFFFISLAIFFKTVGYGVYEFKNNNNKFGGTFIFIISIITIIFFNIMVYLR